MCWCSYKSSGVSEGSSCEYSGTKIKIYTLNPSKNMNTVIILQYVSDTWDGIW